MLNDLGLSKNETTAAAIGPSQTDTDTAALPKEKTVISIFSTTNTHSFMISTLTLSILLFILKPSILLNSTQLLSLSLFNC